MSKDQNEVSALELAEHAKQLVDQIAQVAVDNEELWGELDEVLSALLLTKLGFKIVPTTNPQSVPQRH